MNRREFNKKALFWSVSLAAAGLVKAKQSCDSITNKNKPNILFCIADDASYPHMGAYGCDWVKTPAFDYVAKNGILFNNAYTPNAKCAPSRACILTGRNSWQLEQAGNHLPLFPVKYKTYAEVIPQTDYHIGFTGKGWSPGIAKDENGKSRNLCGKPYNQKTLTPPTEHIYDGDYFENFKDFLNDCPQDTPFCFWYGGFEPHRKYEYGSGIKKGRKKISEIDKVYKFWPENDVVKTDMLDYAYELEYFDTQLQKMLDLLEKQGKLDNTLVVVTADNGMPFPRVKGQAYYHSNHLPLAIMWKNGIKNPGRTVDDFVNFIDFAPTFLEVMGANESKNKMHPIQGKSLTDIFYSSKSGLINPERDHVLLGKERHDVGRPNDWGYPIRAILKGDFLFIKNFETERWPSGNPETGYLNTDGGATKTECLDARDNVQSYKYWQYCFGKRPSEELYNIKSDPDCINNLADNEDYKQIKKQLKDQMFKELKEQNDPRMFGNGDIFDEYKVCYPEYRDFYERYTSGEDIPTPWVEDSDFRPLN